jgi:hypothetical protein
MFAAVKFTALQRRQPVTEKIEVFSHHGAMFKRVQKLGGFSRPFILLFARSFASFPDTFFLSCELYLIGCRPQPPPPPPPLTDVITTTPSP